MHAGLALVVIMAAAREGASMPRNVTLAHLIRRSHFVFVVAVANPPSATIEIPIAGTNKRSDVPVPSFKRVRSRYLVQDALGAAGKDMVGKMIEVDAASWEDDLSRHRQYYLDGIDETVHFERYVPTGPVAPSAAFIVFLRSEQQAKDSLSDARSEARFIETVGRARETLASRATIKALLSTRPSSPR